MKSSQATNYGPRVSNEGGRQKFTICLKFQLTKLSTLKDTKWWEIRPQTKQKKQLVFLTALFLLLQ